MTPYNPGDVVLVRFPFTDLTSAKKRPGLIVSPVNYSSLHDDVVVLALTSQPQSDKSLRLSSWKKSGLPKPTWLKPVIGTLAADVVDKKLGELSAKDFERVKKVVALIISGEFLP